MFAPVRKLRKADLTTLRLVTMHQGREVPTVGGILLFGNARERHFPDAWIQMGRFRGTDKSEIVDRAEIRVHLPQTVEVAIQFVQKHALHGAVIGAARHQERWSLPPVAEVTISGNLGELLKGVQMVGNDLEMRDSIDGPTVKFAEITVGGKGAAWGRRRHHRSAPPRGGGR